MNEENTSINDILQVAGGNRDLKVGFYTNEIIYIGITIFVAVFIAVLLAAIVTKKIA